MWSKRKALITKDKIRAELATTTSGGQPCHVDLNGSAVNSARRLPGCGMITATKYNTPAAATTMATATPMPAAFATTPVAEHFGAG